MMRYVLRCFPFIRSNGILDVLLLTKREMLVTVSLLMLSQRNFDFEVEAYKLQLEDVYKLCWSCERKVNKILHRQNATLCNRLRGSPPSPRYAENGDLNSSNLSNSSTCLVSVFQIKRIHQQIRFSRLDSFVEALGEAVRTWPIL